MKNRLRAYLPIAKGHCWCEERVFAFVGGEIIPPREFAPDSSGNFGSELVYETDFVDGESSPVKRICLRIPTKATARARISD